MKFSPFVLLALAGGIVASPNAPRADSECVQEGKFCFKGTSVDCCPGFECKINDIAGNYVCKAAIMTTTTTIAATTTTSAKPTATECVKKGKFCFKGTSVDCCPGLECKINDIAGNYVCKDPASTLTTTTTTKPTSTKPTTTAQPTSTGKPKVCRARGQRCRRGVPGEICCKGFTCQNPGLLGYGTCKPAPVCRAKGQRCRRGVPGETCCKGFTCQNPGLLGYGTCKASRA